MIESVQHSLQCNLCNFTSAILNSSFLFRSCIQKYDQGSNSTLFINVKSNNVFKDTLIWKIEMFWWISTYPTNLHRCRLAFLSLWSKEAFQSESPFRCQWVWLIQREGIGDKVSAMRSSSRESLVFFLPKSPYWEGDTEPISSLLWVAIPIHIWLRIWHLWPCFNSRKTSLHGTRWKTGCTPHRLLFIVAPWFYSSKENIGG